MAGRTGDLALAAAPGADPLVNDDPVVAQIARQLATNRLSADAVVVAVTQCIASEHPGTWIAALINKDSRTIRVAAASHEHPGLARAIEEAYSSAEPAASNIASRVIDSGEPVLIPRMDRERFLEALKPEIRAQLSPRWLPEMAGTGYVGMLAVPMRARGAIVGTLGVLAEPGSPMLTERGAAWLQTIADHAGLAAENAQLHADGSRRQQRLSALHNTTLLMAAAADLQLVLPVILDHLRMGLGVDAADVLLLEDSGEHLRLAAQAGFHSTSTHAYRLPADDSLAGSVLKSQRVQTFSDGRDLMRFRRRTLLAREGIRWYGAAPIAAYGRAAGVLEVFQRSILEPDDEWLAFLETMAGLAAVAASAFALREAAKHTVNESAGNRHAWLALTQLERQILGLLVEGTTNSAIAQSVHVSQSTVKFHVRQILQKAGVDNRTELARRATREGWL